ncbi:MAG: GTP cyclohydrolase II [Flavobacteriales bacterium]|nr:GTP cyclohydrolase II [Flavobacteriales bacterium]
MNTQLLVTSRIPSVYGNFTVQAWKSKHEHFPHVVLLNVDPTESKTINVRIHSECMTGDLFGSTRCDCGEQFASAMRYLEEHGGIMIYLRQEGRGIGLVDKLKAYNLQDEGMDTIHANHALGYHTDERHYSDAVDILKALDVKCICLLTNNPDKLDAMANSGITVTDRIPLLVDPRPENRHYLQIKKELMGHLL